jgi:glycosyltransferase involved in cell wall biosynthesis
VDTEKILLLSKKVEMLKVVVSGVNLVEGGILSILQDSLKAFSKLQKEYNLDITVLLHNKNLIGDLRYENGFHFIEYPQIKSSWLRRLYFEFIYSKKLSNQLKPDIWFSLHDITPTVNCHFQVVYCHNPSPFYELKKKYFFTDITFTMFNLFYKYLYKINIRKNAYVIIQQDWLRTAFKKMYGVNTIVAHPLQTHKTIETNVQNVDHLNIDFTKTTFFFPSIPRVFKNFELICEATQKLETEIGNFEVILTLDGNENNYAEAIYKKYKHVKSLKFIGVQKRDIIQKLYSKIDCLLFPSKLETWGLPISEFKLFDKPILLSDLPYAHENIGTFKKAKFFDPNDVSELSIYMRMFIEKRLIFDNQNYASPDFPFFKSWDDLLIFLIQQSKATKSLFNLIDDMP